MPFRPGFYKTHKDNVMTTVTRTFRLRAEVQRKTVA